MAQSAGAKVSQAASSGRPRIDYFYDAQIGNFHFGEGHPMRPHRVRLTHHLMVNYGLYKHVNIFRPKMATRQDMAAFHSDDYISFLQDITQDNMAEAMAHLERFNLGADCPVFDGIYEYCQSYAGGSISGAARLNQGCSDIVLNWSGGMHHAKKSESSGFCYVNDIVRAHAPACAGAAPCASDAPLCGAGRARSRSWRYGGGAVVPGPRRRAPGTGAGDPHRWR